MTEDKEQKMSDNDEKTEENTEEVSGNSDAAEDNPDSAVTDNETEKLRAEIAKLKDAYLRAYAESENTKKRCQQEIEKNAKFALSAFAKELLPVADNLHRAIASVSAENREQYKSLLEGVEMTQKELTKVFNKFGIKKIDSLDKVFDPNFEQVVQEIEDTEKPAGTVVAELQSAYLLNDRILREAMVIVTKGGKK
ncbi:MAG: nucleotide exchange factor GrpE [Alphaproteobacteria bacterium]|nr:nucleotide exchange factor GrpE [Alphaproteobacteria bacterium]